MQNSIDLTQLFYEIAMSIGLTLDLNKMLKVSLTTYLKSLNCSTGAILYCDKDDENRYHFSKIYALPRNIQYDEAYQRTLKQLTKSLSKKELTAFRSKLPLTGGKKDGGFYHLLDLPGFGLMLLIKAEKQIDNQIIKSISPLNAKLAVACNACLQNRELHKAHQKAIDINLELRNKTLELEKSQKALRDSETKYRTIFENTQDVFYQTDLEGTILEISPSISKYTNLSRDQLLGSSVTMIYHDPEDHTRLLDSLKDKKEVEDFQLRLKDKLGREIFTSVNAHIVENENGKAVAIEGSMRDITLRKQAEETLRESDRMKSNFVSSVSHELRTPLASILGFSSTILRDKKMNEGTKEEFIKIIHQESQRLSKLIEDILNISRIESGRISYKMEKIDFRPVIAEIIEVHKIQAGDKNITLTHESSDDDNEIFADGDAMKQVLTNLFGNAIKFTPEGGKINIRLYKKNENKIFEIIDSGLGIPEKDKNKIFEKFYRVYRPGIEIQGTGLGLSIVKEILDAHDVTMEVISEEGKGTTFRLIFPTELFKHEKD